MPESLFYILYHIHTILYLKCHMNFGRTIKGSFTKEFLWKAQNALVLSNQKREKEGTVVWREWSTSSLICLGLAHMLILFPMEKKVPL